MSSQVRVMHDEGPFTAAVHHHGSHGPHAPQAGHANPQAAVTVADAVGQCPYEAKVVPNGTTARMVLMFLRDLVEGPASPQMTYNCPMMKCYAKFTEPFPLIQHLLSCPELPNGEFDCDKCSNWHEFPTNEEDWSRWRGWSGRLLHRQNSHTHGSGDIQRKRSFSSKVRGAFSLGKKDRKPGLGDGHFTTTSRPGTSASTTSSVINMGTCPEHAAMVFPGHAAPPNFVDLQKQLVPSTAPQIDSSTILWPAFDTDLDMESGHSSIAPSFETGTPKGTSTNTSQTTLFNTGLPFQSPTADMMTPPFMFSPQTPFDNAQTPLAPMAIDSIDEPMTGSDSLSPADSATPNNRTWWGGKLDIDTPRPTPVASPFYGMNQSMGHPLSRTMSQESIQTPIPGLYQRALSEGTPIEPMSPHADHIHHHQDLNGRAGSPTEELVCDECQWKPRGVRENLRGYLRKHKNTHKGLRLPCDVVGCPKTFSRLDNLKKHKKDKHGIEDSGSVLPLKRVAEEAENMEDETPENKRSLTLTEADIRGASGDYSMLWPALHF
ncbi:zinc finger C2H2-like protein [Echria macrotheca]|uniref:Zinc finger C2H2-like protein n=1 Tax=Echria macrotheca TaxID=438768 RepID=A0AAJ0BHQ5_9PEZI|nr:zinc finger C2H2-like protein [Echria macrotheca]